MWCSKRVLYNILESFLCVGVVIEEGLEVSVILTVNVKGRF
jgi:hypothetical protein